MSQSEVLGFPQLAPLATPFVQLLMEHQDDLWPTSQTLPLSLQGQIEQASQQLHNKWLLFERRVQEKREQTYTMMTPAVHVDSATGEQYVVPAWLRETLLTLAPAHKNKKKEAITPQTFSVWSEKHVLRHRGWGQLEAQSVAGIVIARQLDETRERFWLPSVVDANEPYWWCYSQAMPVNGISAPIVPCPIPLPTSLPPATLLWTPWSGASWDSLWLQIGYLGAIRWAGASLDKQGRTQWNVSESDLKRWDPEIVSLDMGFLRHTREMLNGVAHLTLLRLALTHLQTSSSLSTH